MRWIVFMHRALVLLLCAGCVSASTAGGNDVHEVDCSGITCDWTTKEGKPIYGATWHEGDLGIDLSNDGRTVIELRDVLFATQHDRQLTLRAVVVRDASVTLAFDVDFYAVGQGQGKTFWDRDPTLLVSRHIEVVDQGVLQFHRPVLVPSEGAAVVLRITKEGTGRAMLDEITLGQ